jgi:hypothetical protein
MVQIKGHVLFYGEIITKMQKMFGSFKNNLKNHKAWKAKIYTKLPDVVQIQVCINHGPQG